MFGLSFLWHGLALTDLKELHIGLWAYCVLSGIAYLLLGILLLMLIRYGLFREWINMKQGFPWTGMLVGAVVGLAVYGVILLSGLSFADHGMQHVMADALWQMFEQAVGGLMVALGIIYDLHRSFMEAEQAR